MQLAFITSNQVRKTQRCCCFSGVFSVFLRKNWVKIILQGGISLNTSLFFGRCGIFGKLLYSDLINRE
ncbi:hypothetical protein GXM_03691 [Nostoc sphaeroides CCNUC1]|uniref:Uncharacterized protein n=1 Tax=Nostoc sphaeroides CCNUC1 TaxID=2653204 RepID=A0A5P8W0T5_9NOSO|nr:hypothetical protein GXM_03691 [Nostoc sphaeroides CCNUC1]